MKVLHINTFDYYGGASQIAFELVHCLDADCTLLVKKKESQSEKVIEIKESFLDKLFVTFDRAIWKLGIKKPLKKVFGISDELHFTYRKLKQIKEYDEADIIHLHNIHGNYFDLSALKKIAEEKHIVWTLHDMWAMTGGEAYTFQNDNYKKGIGKTPYKKVYPLENPFWERRQYFLKLKKEIYLSINSKITFVTVCSWLQSCLLDAYVHNEGMKAEVIHNGIRTSVFKNLKKRNWTKPRILFFHVRSAYKGNELFIKMHPRIKEDHELIIVGEPLKSIEAYTHIKYVNNREHLNEIYNSADILIFPSLAESFPLTILEALACGVCIVASDAGGIPEVLNNSAGYIFKNGDEEELLKKTNYALKNLDESRDKAASVNIENFSFKKCADAYLTLYKQILNNI